MSSEPGNANAAKPPIAVGAFQNGSNLGDRALFLQKFLAKGRVISSAVPSSRAMVEGVLRNVDFSRPATIVELGAGIGPLTAQVLERINSHHRFVAVENDEDFCDVLRRRFPDANILQADVARMREPLAGLGIGKVDYVLSGLPTPSLPMRSMVRLFDWLREALAPDGLFLQITVAPLIYRKFYERLFRSVEYRMVWWNLPPGGVYRCASPR